MPIQEFILKGEDVPFEVDVPIEFAKDKNMAEQWVGTVYLPYRDSGLAAAEKDPEHPLSFLPDWAARGAYRLAQSANIVQSQLGMDEETNAKDIQDYQKHLEKVPYDKDVLDALIKMSDANSVGEFWDAASTTDGLLAIGNVVGESFTQFLPVIAATIAAIPLTFGQSVWAGSAILGAISGLGSMGVEYGAASLAAMNDYLHEKGTNARDDKAVGLDDDEEFEMTREELGEIVESAKVEGLEDFTPYSGLDYPVWMPGGLAGKAIDFFSRTVIGTGTVGGVGVHIHKDGSVTPISPEDSPGYDHESMKGENVEPVRRRKQRGGFGYTQKDVEKLQEEPLTGMSGLLAKRGPTDKSAGTKRLEELLASLYPNRNINIG